MNSIKITYRIEKNPDPREVAEVFRDSGLRRPVDELERIGRMLENSDLTIRARDNGKLVGIARVLTDFSYCCYLSDLTVKRTYQRKGIGRELIRRVREAIGEESMLLLLSAPEAKSYYPHLGFDKLDNAWEILRKR